MLSFGISFFFSTSLQVFKRFEVITCCPLNPSVVGIRGYNRRNQLIHRSIFFTFHVFIVMNVAEGNYSSWDLVLELKGLIRRETGL